MTDYFIVGGDVLAIKERSTAFIIESNRFIREVTIIKQRGDLCVVRFSDKRGGIQIRSSRLYSTREEADAKLPKPEKVQHKSRTPYDYMY